MRTRQHSFDELENILVLVSDIRLCQGTLIPDELPFIRNAAPKRVREFTAGRHIARQAMRQMGVPAAAIPVAENRCPVWPRGVIGSISHTNDTVGIALARTHDYVSIGFDIEAAGP
jgi:4'-phosphopantetheinyl transferase EntD